MAYRKINMDYLKGIDALDGYYSEDESFVAAKRSHYGNYFKGGVFNSPWELQENGANNTHDLGIYYDKEELCDFIDDLVDELIEDKEDSEKISILESFRKKVEACNDWTDDKVLIGWFWDEIDKEKELDPCDMLIDAREGLVRAWACDDRKYTWATVAEAKEGFALEAAGRLSGISSDILLAATKNYDGESDRFCEYATIASEYLHDVCLWKTKDGEEIYFYVGEFEEYCDTYLYLFKDEETADKIIKKFKEACYGPCTSYAYEPSAYSSTFSVVMDFEELEEYGMTKEKFEEWVVTLIQEQKNKDKPSEG